MTNANTKVLRNALRSYIKAVNSLKPNMRTNQAITNLLNQANVNANNKRVIRNRLANGVAKIVFASRPAIAQAAIAVASGAPEAPAAAAVINATTQINAAPPPAAINRTLLNVVLAKTTNQKLAANINNRSKSAALVKELKNTAVAVGVNLANKNVNAALTRIMNHESRLPVAAGTTVTNRSRLNAALAKSMNQMLTANITNRSQANALMAEVRNSAQAAGVNLAATNVSAALNRIVQHQSRLN
jgi:hypothetical protein